MPVTLETRLIHQYGGLWLETIRSIIWQERQREPEDAELALHMAWVLEQHDGGWDAEKMRAYVRAQPE